MDEDENQYHNNSAGGSILGLIIFIVVGVFVYNNYIKSDTWKGYFYPNPSDLTYSIPSPTYDSLEQCRSWVTTQAKADVDGAYDYECGKNCKVGEYTVEVCEETLR